MGLAKKTVHGTVWASLTFGMGKFLLFVSSVILARLLTPSDFGLAALTLLVIDFLGIAEDIGVSQALIYKKERPDLVASTSFWISCLAGLTLLILAALVSPAAAVFFDEPRVEPLVQLLAVSFLITSFGSTHEALLKKELDFKKKLIPELAQAFFRGFISILLAWLGWGVWSLIWGQVIGALSFTVSAWLVLPWRPSFIFDRKMAKELISYGYQIVMTDLLGTIGSRTDLLFIGKLINEAALGFYNLAFKIPDLAIMSIMTVTGQVIFPAYAKLQHDRPALRRAFLVTLRFISLVAFPLGFGLFIVAPELVHVLYTDKWEPAIPALQVLSLFATIRIVGWAGTGSVYKATGRPDIISLTSFLRTILLVPASWWGISQYGIVGAAFAQLVVTLLISCVNLYVAHRMLQIKLSTILGEMQVAFFGSVLMVTSVQIFLYFAATMPILSRLIIALILGASVYSLSIWLLSRETVLLARKMIGFAPSISK